MAVREQFSAQHCHHGNRTLCSWRHVRAPVTINSDNIAFIVTFIPFLQRAAIAIAIPSVRLSVRHTPVLCQNDGT